MTTEFIGEYSLFVLDTGVEEEVETGCCTKVKKGGKIGRAETENDVIDAALSVKGAVTN